MRLAAIIVAALLLIGCADKSIDQQMSEWVGRPVMEAFKEYGPPQASWQDGELIGYLWQTRRSATVVFPGMGAFSGMSFGQRVDNVCSIAMVANAAHIIVKADWFGDCN